MSEYVAAALYDEHQGFYQLRGSAGRRGDFLTAPEVGPLFGAVLARALDSWWKDLGCPQPFTVLEWGAGPGTLARSVFAAEPELLRCGALQWNAIELAAAQRATHLEHPSLASTAQPPAERCEFGVVLANELLDNLPFDIYQRRAQQWFEVRVDVAKQRHEFVTVEVPLKIDEHHLRIVEALNALLSTVDAEPLQVVWQSAAQDWLNAALNSLRYGRVVVFDYGASSAELAARGDWVRTFRGHQPGRPQSWLNDPSGSDITADVAVDQLELVCKADCNRTQAEFLQAHGIDDLVAAGKQQWQATAHIGDLTALRARSRIREAETLCDPTAMGSYRALEWQVGCQGDIERPLERRL
ncbi:MAG: SAM-dependent methyltransferase [Acidimicrobiia bacterium]|nr:SAM-dependent methyltransferase [Acidimicrobiia bacterium]MCY4458657.1 SAM-dependent methyltransferase [Acidimicrobiaceae bacterium]